MTKLSKGQILYTSIGPVTILSCGNGNYRVKTGKFTHSMTYAEVQAEIESGRATLADMSLYAKHEISGRHYTNVMNEYAIVKGSR